MTRLPRYERPTGAGRIRCYDNGGATIDRYTVLFEDRATMHPRTYESLDRPVPYGLRSAFITSANPHGAYAVSTLDYAYPPQTWGTGARDRRILFADLPEAVRAEVVGILNESEAAE